MDLTPHKTLSPMMFRLGETCFLAARSNVRENGEDLSAGRYDWMVRSTRDLGAWGTRNQEALTIRFSSRRALVSYMQALIEVDPPPLCQLKPPRKVVPVRIARIEAGRYTVTALDGGQVSGLLRRGHLETIWILESFDGNLVGMYATLAQVRADAGADLISQDVRT